MADMKKLVQSRQALKGWVTREVNDLTELLKKKTLSINLLKMKVSEFDKHLNSFDEAQSKIETEIVDPADMAADIDEVFAI
jgi:hypothetical protein